MRLMLEPTCADTDALVEAARTAWAAGLDGVMITSTPALSAPLVAAAYVAGLVPDLLMAVELPLGDRHPIEVLEEAVVVDLAIAGRLVLVTRPVIGAAHMYPEALDLVRTALSPAPFRFDGSYWRVPARLAQNIRGTTEARVTPSPARARLEVWSAGPGFAAGVSRGLGHLADADDDPAELAREWTQHRMRIGPALTGAPRARRALWTDAEQLIVSLRSGRASFGQDWAVVAAPTTAAAEIGMRVRPRLQLNELPAGLEAHWDLYASWHPSPRTADQSQREEQASHVGLKDTLLHPATGEFAHQPTEDEVRAEVCEDSR